MKLFKNLFSLIFVFILGLGVGIGFWVGKSYWGGNGDQGAFPSIHYKSPNPDSYASSVTKAKEAVVNIYPEIMATQPSSPFNYFLWELFKQRGGSPFPPQRKIKGSGSGVIISAEGYILTNNHVIQQAESIKVSVPGIKNEFTAKLVGSDKITDLALLKIENPSKKSFPYVSFADSEQLLIGDVVLAIGNSFGLGQSVTMGIISALNREGIDQLGLQGYIQTDAAINPGNSGGALVDNQGRLVGINTAIFTKSGGYDGIGFAIPSNLAQNIAQQLKENGKVKRANLGIAIADLRQISNDPLIIALRNQGHKEGAFVTTVYEKGSASKAGLKAGSLIIEVAGKKISNTKELIKIITNIGPEEKIELKAISLDSDTGKLEEKTYLISPNS